MSARYGDKTRSGEPVSNAGQRQVASGGGSAVQVYEQEFLAPGTWTWPGVCTEVEVLVVSGGSSGSRAPALPVPTAGQFGTAGAGGKVGTFVVPVSAPVPVTVGAGGTTPSWPGPTPTRGPNAGGDSAFGPTAPPIPTNTSYVTPTSPDQFITSDRYGYGASGLTGSPDGWVGGFGSARPAWYPQSATAESGWANTGEGGGSWSNQNIPTPYGPPYTAKSPYFQAGDGGSGIVIVRWYE